MSYIKYISKLFLIALGRTGIVLLVCFFSVLVVIIYYKFMGDPRCMDGYVAKEGEMIMCQE